MRTKTNKIMKKSEKTRLEELLDLKQEYENYDCSTAKYEKIMYKYHAMKKDPRSVEFGGIEDDVDKIKRNITHTSSVIAHILDALDVEIKHQKDGTIDRRLL